MSKLNRVNHFPFKAKKKKKMIYVVLELCNSIHVLLMSGVKLTQIHDFMIMFLSVLFCTTLSFAKFKRKTKELKTVTLYVGRIVTMCEYLHCNTNDFICRF